MKRLLTFIVAACTLLAVTVSCYDDSALKGEIDNLKDRVSTLEDMMKTANSNISALQDVIRALENKLFVNSISQTTEGYLLKFSDGTSVTIKNGHSPMVSADKYNDVYYWTVDGEWLLDKEGKKIPVTGVAPELKIENGRWLLSTDGGNTWTDVGQATGDPGKDGKDGSDGSNGNDGADGDSFFKDITWDNSFVYLTLSDGRVLSLPLSSIKDILRKVQSIVYVPDYDDMKITVNSATIRCGNEAVLLDQPSEITYQILPAQYATEIAESIQTFYSAINKGELPYWGYIMNYCGSDLKYDSSWQEWRDELKDFGMNNVFAWFDVKPLKTRSGDGNEDIKYGIRILEVVSSNDSTGEIRFKVQPVNIASANFLYNGLKPHYDVDYYQNSWVVPVWDYNELANYQKRSAFAVQLRLYQLQDFEILEDEFIDYDNEIASSYTTLYPNVLNSIELLKNVYVPKQSGNGLARYDGEETQYLPYNVFRKNGTEAEPGYRTILDGVTPAFVINGKIVSAKEAYDLGYMISYLDTPTKTITYNGIPSGAVLNNDEYYEEKSNYIEVEMNPDATESERKAAINGEVIGKYTFNTPFGPIECSGKVIITGDSGMPTSNFDFLHMTYYTFNSKKESEPFIYKHDFAANDGSVEWWTQVNPRYYTDKGIGATADRVSFRHALADYNPGVINLAELSFNVVDKNDHYLTEEEMNENGLEVRFVYKDPGLDSRNLPELNITWEFNKYLDLWLDKTIFCFNTNEYQFIPMKGILYKDGKEIPTRFSQPKNSVKYPSESLDYSSFALVNWTPFKELTSESFRVNITNSQTFIPLDEKINLKDNRPNGVSYYVIKEGEWVVGNVSDFDPEAGTYSINGNGYVYGVSSKEAYSISKDLQFSFDYSGIPRELRPLISIVYSYNGQQFYREQDDGMRVYLLVDLSTQVSIHGLFDIPVHVELPNPWQPTLETDFTVSLFYD